MEEEPVSRLEEVPEWVVYDHILPQEHWDKVKEEAERNARQ